MLPIILFYLSFVSIVAMLVIKHYNITVIRHEAISEMVSKNEENIHKIAGTGKKIASKIHLENLNRLFTMVINFIKNETIVLKRKFDSKQPKFLLKTENHNDGNKHSVSFFLKNISEQKNLPKKKGL